MNAKRSADSSAAERIGGGRPKPSPKRPDDELDFAGHLRAWLENHRASLADSLGRLAKHPFGSLFTCLVMAVALSLPMGLALLLDNIERLGGSWQRAAQISLFLRMDVPPEGGARLQAEIQALPEVAEAELISREQALVEFQQLSGLGEALRELPDNPLPAVILVTPEEVDKDRLEQLRAQLAGLPGVELAQLDLVWVERLTAILKLGDRFVFGLSLLLIATLLLVIGNTIRLHIENRRTEIEVVKLVGGTDGYVRRPFLYMGALYGLGAGLLAWLLLAYGLAWLNEAVISLAGLYGSEFSLGGVPLEDGIYLVIGAVFLGYIGAWLAVARHLNELAPR